MSIQFLPQVFMPEGLRDRYGAKLKRRSTKRKRKPTWLMLCSWDNASSEYFLVPMSSPRRIIDELLDKNENTLIIWKSVSLKPDHPPTMESLKLLPAEDERMIGSMRRTFKKRIVWKQLERVNNDKK